MARLNRLTAGKEEFWRSLVDEQGRCGVSVRAFCRQKAVSEPSFYAWRKKLNELDAERVVNAGSNGRLIAVDVISPTCENSTPSSDDGKTPLEICTPAGFTLRFDHHASPETISRLLDVMNRCQLPSEAGDGAMPC